MEDFYLEMKAGYFDRSEMRLIEAMEDGDKYILIHIKLMLLGCKDNGRIKGSPQEICSLINERDSVFFANAVGLFEILGLVEFESQRVFYITDFQSGECRRKEYVESRNTYEYKAWRIAVCERDHYTCQRCGRNGERIEAHHIKPWAKFKEFRYDVDNGIALCVDCHRQEHKRRK